MKCLPCTTAGAVALSCLIGMAITVIGSARYDAPLGVHAASAGVQASEGNGGSPNPCAPPTSVTSPPHETAWRLWVAATCPVNQNQYPYVVWQNWIEQAQMYPPDPANGLKVPNALAEAHSATHQFHPSPLTLSTGEPPQLSDENCTVAKDPPPDHPNLVICEEVRLNGATEDYIAGNSLWNRPGQQHMATTGGTIQFPPAAVSIKADWLRLDSCENPPPGVHIEEVNGRCYALAGMHLMSKLLPNWLWATFEPQNLTTNPNRCVVLGCFDPWGVKSPVQSGRPQRGH